MAFIGDEFGGKGISEDFLNFLQQQQQGAGSQGDGGEEGDGNAPNPNPVIDGPTDKTGGGDQGNRDNNIYTPLDDNSSGQSPRDREATQKPSEGPATAFNPDMERTQTPPSPEAYLPSFLGGQGGIGGDNQPGAPTPPRPEAPSPTAAQPAAPVQPLPAPSPQSMVTPLSDTKSSPLQFDQLGKSSLLGQSGGLLGGGLSTTGKEDSGSDTMDSLLPMLLQLLGK